MKEAEAPGVPAGQVAAALPQKFHDKLEEVDEQMRLTCGEFFSRLRRFAAGFQTQGVGLGDRVCVHLENSVENVVVLFSIPFTGASVLLSNPVLNESELLFQVGHGDATHILTSPQHAAKVHAVKRKTNVKGLFVIGEPVPGFVSVSDFTELNEDDFKEVPIGDPKQTTVAVYFSSGTTGDAKGVEVSHYNLVANLHMTKAMVNYELGDVLLTWYPINTAGFMFTPVAASTGATCVVVHHGLTFDQFVYYVRKYDFIDMDTGEKVGPKQYGELYFRIPSVMKGYYKNPALMKEFMDDDGWCKSGDLMYYDEDGRVYFVDRMKDMIKCLDQQVSSLELECLLQSHPSIADAAVVGVAKTMYGDAPAAFVVVRHPTDASPEVAAILKEHVACKTEKFKHLYGGVVFMDRLPRNANGKVIKRELKLLYEKSKVY
nr:probable 4-coumarate--CoA ligase 2 [Dermacentor andersoni]